MPDQDAPVVVAGRFADPLATTTIPLGVCRCGPGGSSIHGEDTAEQRTEFGDGELKSAYGTATRFRSDGTAYFDEGAGDDAAIAKFTRSWTLTAPNGRGKPEPVPIDIATVALLDADTRAALLEPINAIIAKRRSRAVPNGSGGSSEESSPGTASQTPKTPRPRSATTRRSSRGEASDLTS
jgi:hypothetical protein